MSKSFTFDGTDLASLNLQVEDYSIPEMAAIGFNSSNAIFGDSFFTSVNHTTRSISLQCAVVDVSTSALRDTLASIRKLLNPILGDKVIVFDHEPDRRYIGRVSSMSTPAVKGFNGTTFTIDLECLGYTQDLDETNTAASVWAASDPFSTTFSSTPGTVSRQPVEIYVRNQTGAKLTSTAITIENTTTNETITWTGTLEVNRWLRFGTLDADGRFSATISQSNSTGTDPEAETYTDTESGFTSGDWIRLQGGADNIIRVNGISDGRLEITFRGRYI